MPVLRLPSVRDLTDPVCLGPVVGPIESQERAPLEPAGLSGARLERLEAVTSGREVRRLVLKTVEPAESWTAYRSGDRSGREALMLDEAALDGIWEEIACPYLAFAMEPGRIGLLMEDLSTGILPAGNRLLREQEDVLLETLAALHARFWEADPLGVSWLAPLPVRFSILAPGAADEELQRHPGHPLFAQIARGWEIALDLVPRDVCDLLLTRAEDLAAGCADLPVTLLHGDAKAGNAAFLPDGRVSLFDWATSGPGPAAIDLFYFLAVDARRHARSRDEIIRRYRELLEGRLGWRFSARLWRRLEEAGAAAAARMLLWRVALDLDRGEAGAGDEWRWWLARLH